jgi:hypothetical protein
MEWADWTQDSDLYSILPVFLGETGHKPKKGVLELFEAVHAGF